MLRAADVSIFTSILARQIDEYGQKMLDNLFKYKATHVLMDIIIGMLCHYIFNPFDGIALHDAIFFPGLFSTLFSHFRSFMVVRGLGV